MADRALEPADATHEPVTGVCPMCGAGETAGRSATSDNHEPKRSEEARFRLAAIVDASVDAIMSKTTEGVLTSWNRGAERIYGYTAEEAVGRHISFLIPPERHREEEEILVRIRRGQTLDQYETVRRRKDGQDIHVSITISPIKDASGAVIGVSKITRDITAKKLAEQSLARAKDAAEAANRELEAFSYSVAHDLRAPLRGIDGFSQAVLEEYGDKLDDQGARYLRSVRASAQQMARLIDGLLTLSRVTRAELSRGRVDLSHLARAAAERLRRTRPDRQVEWAIAEGLGAVGDPRLLAIVIDNLLGNAWKFTGKRPSALIEFGSDSSAAGAGGPEVFFVRDNGAGFEMTYASKLFGVFQRLHAVSEFEGTGIGLATVQRIIRRHGGRVWAEAELDRGACFYFTLEGEET